MVVAWLLRVADLNIFISETAEEDSWVQVVDADLEHRAGDHLFTLENAVKGQFVKFEVVRGFPTTMCACHDKVHVAGNSCGA